MGKLKAWLRQDQRRTTMLLFILLFAIIGTVAIITSRAATPSIAIEAENGVTGPATRINDSGASGGAAIQFNDGTIHSSGFGVNGKRLGIATGYPYASDKDYPSKFSMSYTSYVNKVADLGVGWIRTDAIINGTQPLNVVDETLTAAKAKNIKVLADFAYGSLSDPDSADAKMTAYVDHWKSLGLDSAIGGYEMNNEVNNSGDSRFPFQDPALYRNWLRKAYPLLKARTPSVPIILSGFAPGGGNNPCCNGNLSNPADYLNKLYSLNGGNSSGMFDHVAMHPYANSTNNYPEGNNHPQSGMRVPYYLRQVMNKYGDQNKQIWGTEAGWTSCGDNGTGAAVWTEAQRSVRMINDINEWFYGTHDSTGKRVGYAASSDLNTGPFMIFKLYKAGTGGSDDSHGILSTNVQSCRDNPAGSTSQLYNTIKLYSATNISNIPTKIAQ